MKHIPDKLWRELEKIIPQKEKAVGRPEFDSRKNAGRNHFYTSYGRTMAYVAGKIWVSNNSSWEVYEVVQNGRLSKNNDLCTRILPKKKQ